MKRQRTSLLPWLVAFAALLAACKGPEPAYVSAQGGGGQGAGQGDGGSGGSGGAVDCDACSIGCGEAGCLQVVDLGAGPAHTCAVLSDGSVRCWGYDERVLTFIDTFDKPAEPGTFTPTPTVVPGLDDAIEVAGGLSHSCARTESDKLVCWGWNAVGQLGTGDQEDSETPREVALGGSVTDLAVGLGHTCAIAGVNELFCWGTNMAGQLGLGSAGRQPRPTPMSIDRFFPENIAAGYEHTCARFLDGEAHCWGGNGSGELGTGDTMPANAPVLVIGEAAAQIATGGNFSCAREGADAVQCWGSNEFGQLGTGTSGANALDPTDAIALTAQLEPDRLVLGNEHGCLLDNEKLFCWGNNEYGQTTHADLEAPTLSPEEVELPGQVSDVALGLGHTCALVDGEAYCWGLNYHGQLGTGDTNASSEPKPVVW